MRLVVLPVLPVLLVLGMCVGGMLVLAPALSATVKSRSAAWAKAEPSAGESATNAMAAAGMQATMRDRAEARLEREGLNVARIGGGLAFRRG